MIWFTDEIPEHEVGKLILHKNPDNYFGDVEQSAFDPANMPPGIEPSPDRLLQGRLFSYLDTQYYRQTKKKHFLNFEASKQNSIFRQSDWVSISTSFL